MGLKDTIKDTKAKLEEATEKEKELETKALETLTETISKAVEEPKKETKVEEKVEEKKEEAKVEEPVKTDADFAKERIAKKKEKDRLAEELDAARARIAALEASLKPVEKPKEDPQPDPNTNFSEWTSWKIRQQETQLKELSTWKAEQDTVRKKETLKDRAMQEVQGFENQLRPKYADYDDVKNHYARILATSIKIVNPKITDMQLADAVNNRLLTRASELLAEGYENPVEAMYLEGKSLGYQPRKTEETKEEVKPDLDKVSSLRKRNAGMAGASGGGSSDAHISPAVASKMTNAEFAKLKPEQKKRLFESLRG